MDPYYIGLQVGLVAGTCFGIFVLAIFVGGRSSQDEEDAARFRALQAHATTVSDDDGPDVPLGGLADKIRAGRFSREHA